MSSKPKQQTATTQKTATERSTSSMSPWGPLRDDVLSLPSLAKSAYDRSTPFAGDFVAAPTPAQRSSVQQTLGAAPGLSTGSGDLRTMAQRIASGEFLDVNNPVLSAAREATINPVEKRLKEDILPFVTDAAIKGGAYGGSANALLNAKALGDFSETASNIGAGMNLDWTNRRFGDIFNSPGLFQSANTLSLAPSMATQVAGDYERGLNQFELDNDLSKYMNEQQMNWGPLQNYYDIINGLAGNFGTKTATGTGTSTGDTTSIGAAPDMATQLLHGGLGSLGVLSSLGSAFPATMGAIGGGTAMAPIMAGLSFLSDPRFKEDVEKIGELDDGQAVYKFQYKHTPGFMIGLMADEVEQVHPEAVTEHGGVKFVNYDLATA